MSRPGPALAAPGLTLAYLGPAALAFVAKTAWFYSFTRPTPARLLLSARAMLAGLRGDFTGHRRYLRG